ncbi:unnamed protein product, partial [Gulo gulo]
NPLVSGFSSSLGYLLPSPPLNTHTFLDCRPGRLYLAQPRTRREHSRGLKGAILAAIGSFLSPTQFSGPSDTSQAPAADGDRGLEREAGLGAARGVVR